MTAASCPGLPPELLKLLNTPLQDCDPEALRLLFSAFARYVATVMPPGMAALGLTDADDVFGYIQGRVGGVLDDTTLAPAAATEPAPAQPDAPSAAPAETAAAQQDGAPAASPSAAAPPSPATLPSAPAAPGAAPPSPMETQPTECPDAGPALPPPEQAPLPEGFLTILAAMFQDELGSPAPSPASPLAALPAAAIDPASAAPGATHLPEPTRPRGRPFPHRRRRVPRRCRSPRLGRRWPPRCATPHDRKTVAHKQRPILLRRRCCAARAGPP